MAPPVKRLIETTIYKIDGYGALWGLEVISYKLPSTPPVGSYWFSKTMGGCVDKYIWAMGPNYFYLR